MFNNVRIVGAISSKVDLNHPIYWSPSLVCIRKNLAGNSCDGRTEPSRLAPLACVGDWLNTFTLSLFDLLDMNANLRGLSDLNHLDLRFLTLENHGNLFQG